MCAHRHAVANNFIKAGWWFFFLEAKANAVADRGVHVERPFFFVRPHVVPLWCVCVCLPGGVCGHVLFSFFSVLARGREKARSKKKPNTLPHPFLVLLFCSVVTAKPMSPRHTLPFLSW